MGLLEVNANSYIFLFLMALSGIIAYLLLRPSKLKGLNMTEDQRIEYLSSQDALNEASKAAFETKHGSNYANMKIAQYQSKLSGEGTQLCNYLLTKFQSKITTIFNALNSLKIQMQTNLQTNFIDLSSESIDSHIQTKVIQDKSDIRIMFEKKQESDMNFHVFRGKYGVTKPCSEKYQESAITILLVFIIVESMVNLWFYRHSFGTIQAWVISIGVSFVNIALGYFLGTLFRFKNIPDSYYKGWLSLAGAIFSTVSFMGAVSWFRLHQDEMSITNALIFDSFILFIFGIFGAGIAFKKGYEADDTIPGYGEICRNKKIVDEMYENSKKTASEKIIAEFDKYDRIFKDLKDNTRKNLDIFQQNINESSTLNSELKGQYKALTTKITTLNTSFKDNFTALLLNENSPEFLTYNIVPPSSENIEINQSEINQYKQDFDKFQDQSSKFLETITEMHTKFNEYRQQNQTKIVDNILGFN